MARHIGFLRFLLVALAVAVLAGCGLLYLASVESAAAWPELAHLQMPVYVAVVVGLVPVAVAIASVFGFLRAVDNGEAFSARAVGILRRLKVLAGVFAAYYAAGLVGFWAVTGLMHATLLYAWLVLEIGALFLLTAAALFQRLFADAFALRTDSELTV